MFQGEYRVDIHAIISETLPMQKQISALCSRVG